MPTGHELLYFLTLNSDIVQENFGRDVIIKRVEAADWRAWFGAVVTLERGAVTGIRRVGDGPYENVDRVLDEGDILGMHFYEHNYVLYGTAGGVRPHIDRFDRAIRLFGTGKSGISSGISQASLEIFHPMPGWRELPPTNLNVTDIPALITLADRIDAATGNKASLLMDRYRNATKKSGVKEYNRFVDLVTILEMLFVPDGGSGEIGYKLRMRASGILSDVSGLTPTDAKATIKRLYGMRSSIVHAGDAGEIPDGTWIQLANLTRLGILEYLRDPDSFTAEALDSRLTG